MSVGQWRRLDVVERIERGEMTIAEGAQVLGLSSRQMKRIRKRVRATGAKAVIHGNCGRAPKHKTATMVREIIVDLRRDKYAGFNDQHFTEKLKDAEGIDVSRETVRRVLRSAGIGAARPRRAVRHRRRRDRRPQAGQMVLWDGSQHDWLEGRGPRLCLMAAIDDATGELLPGAHFVDQECTVGYLRVLRDIVKHKGVPLSAYMDRHSALKRNDQHWTRDEQLAGRQDPTQVRRALDDLGIEVIYALSPQAKGRVERLWGTLQDRLVSELRLANACNMKQANRILQAYRIEHNERFAIPPKDRNEAWRSCPPGLSPSEICALQYVRLVRNNNTIRIGCKTIDIRRQPWRATFANAKVIVRQLLTGQYRVYYEGRLIGTAAGSLPNLNKHIEPRTVEGWTRSRGRATRRRETEEVTESLTC